MEDPQKSIQQSLEIEFSLSKLSLAYFKDKSRDQQNYDNRDSNKQLKLLVNKMKKEIRHNNVKVEQFHAPLNIRVFNESLMIMQIDNIDVYIDKSTRKKSTSSGSGLSDKEEQQDYQHDKFVESCVRVITEETDNTSNSRTHSSHHLTPVLTPRQSQLNPFYDIYGFYPARGVGPVRNRHSVTVEESRRFIIDYQKIDSDERTTIMVKNIPNKYTQEMMLEELSINYENKFDFFYLPIDKDNDCNVGYAFVNFINTTYLKEFFKQFHLRRWKKYKSSKICNIFYARYQGTLQLADHFKNTKIMNQKDRKIKPLTGITDSNKIKDLRQIIKNQRNQD